MTTQKNTLFSIKDPVLKKERAFSLLVMRVFFIFSTISIALFLVFTLILGGIAFFLINENYLRFYSFIYVSLPLTVTMIGALFVVRNQWNMQLWVYDLLVLSILLCFVYDIFFASISLFHLVFTLVILCVLIYVAHTIRQFFSSSSGDGEKNTLGIDTKLVWKIPKERMIETKEDVLFSIKSEELRKRCRFSLFFMRVAVIVLCFLLLGYVYKNYFSFIAYFELLRRDLTFPTSARSMVSFFPIGLFVVVWKMLKLAVWPYTLLGIFSFLFFLNGFVFFQIFSPHYSVAEQACFIVGLLFYSAIPFCAWKVHRVRKQHPFSLCVKK